MEVMKSRLELTRGPKRTHTSATRDLITRSRSIESWGEGPGNLVRSAPTPGGSMIRNSTKTYALCSSALVALAFASSAHAQGEGAAAEEVVVTGSRVVTNGFAQPTPVTVLTMEQMQ